ncbi:MAG: hypothetical protein GX589_02965, partial [Deltaproteobacteria bacterium]|nr:hypothetical protein [Deltaproteobacteria bacterium]
KALDIGDDRASNQNDAQPSALAKENEQSHIVSLEKASDVEEKRASSQNDAQPSTLAKEDQQSHIASLEKASDIEEKRASSQSDAQPSTLAKEDQQSHIASLEKASDIEEKRASSQSDAQPSALAKKNQQSHVASLEKALDIEDDRASSQNDAQPSALAKKNQQPHIASLEKASDVVDERVLSQSDAQPSALAKENQQLHVASLEKASDVVGERASSQSDAQPSALAKEDHKPYIASLKKVSDIEDELALTQSESQCNLWNPALQALASLATQHQNFIPQTPEELSAWKVDLAIFENIQTSMQQLLSLHVISSNTVRQKLWERGLDVMNITVENLQNLMTERTQELQDKKQLRQWQERVKLVARALESFRELLTTRVDMITSGQQQLWEKAFKVNTAIQTDINELLSDWTKVQAEPEPLKVWQVRARLLWQSLDSFNLLLATHANPKRPISTIIHPPPNTVNAGTNIKSNSKENSGHTHPAALLRPEPLQTHHRSRLDTEETMAKSGSSKPSSKENNTSAGYPPKPWTVSVEASAPEQQKTPTAVMPASTIQTPSQKSHIQPSLLDDSPTRPAGKRRTLKRARYLKAKELARRQRWIINLLINVLLREGMNQRLRKRFVAALIAEIAPELLGSIDFSIVMQEIDTALAQIPEEHVDEEQFRRALLRRLEENAVSTDSQDSVSKKMIERQNSRVSLYRRLLRALRSGRGDSSRNQLPIEIDGTVTKAEVFRRYREREQKKLAGVKPAPKSRPSSKPKTKAQKYRELVQKKG